MADRDHLDPIEDALLDLRSAEQAGVFERTTADAQRMLSESPAGSLPAKRRLLPRWLAVAAAIALAICSAALSP